MIYWARSGDTAMVKVGYAVTVERRIALLQTGNPLPLILLRTAPGDRDLEGALHRFYHPQRIRSEWFALSDDDVAIDLATIPMLIEPSPRPNARPNVWDCSVGRMIQALGGPDLVAAEFGASRTAVYNWRHDGIPSRLWPDFVEKAAAKKIKGVTFDALKATRRRARETPALGPASEAAA